MLKFIVADPDPGPFLTLDPGSEKIGTGIKRLGSATQQERFIS
jgi:hypothetical protein